MGEFSATFNFCLGRQTQQAEEQRTLNKKPLDSLRNL